MNEFTIKLGKKLRESRALAGFSQTDVGNKLGVSFQQIQKYEKGYNRIPFEGIITCSKMFGVPVSYFYDDDQDVQIQSTRRHDIELVRYFQKLSHEERSAVLALVKLMAAGPEES